MRMYIKNMSCARCSLVVTNELERHGFMPVQTGQGEIEIGADLTDAQQEHLSRIIDRLGVEVIADREAILSEKVMAAIIQLIESTPERTRMKLSEYLSMVTGYTYHYLNTVFSRVNGISVERFYIRKRIDRVKEILVHDSLTFSEIAYRLHFSSVAHLSHQFKKETGLTLTQFREIKRGSIQGQDFT